MIWWSEPNDDHIMFKFKLYYVLKYILNICQFLLCDVIVYTNRALHEHSRKQVSELSTSCCRSSSSSLGCGNVKLEYKWLSRLSQDYVEYFVILGYMADGYIMFELWTQIFMLMHICIAYFLYESYYYSFWNEESVDFHGNLLSSINIIFILSHRQMYSCYGCSATSLSI